MSKICKKGYMEMTKKIYLETLKSVLGRSISHYSAARFLKCAWSFWDIMNYRVSYTNFQMILFDIMKSSNIFDPNITWFNFGIPRFSLYFSQFEKFIIRSLKISFTKQGLILLTVLKISIHKVLYLRSLTVLFSWHIE